MSIYDKGDKVTLNLYPYEKYPSTLQRWKGVVCEVGTIVAHPKANVSIMPIEEVRGVYPVHLPPSNVLPYK